MIREIFRRIGTGNRTFLELGVGNGQVNNTTFLLAQGWKGYWLEADAGSVSTIRRDFATPLATAQLTLLHALATVDGAAECLNWLGVPPELDLLSVDVDRNTYWVLAALLRVLRPRVAVVEYNATYPAISIGKPSTMRAAGGTVRRTSAPASRPTRSSAERMALLSSGGSARRECILRAGGPLWRSLREAIHRRDVLRARPVLSHPHAWAPAVLQRPPAAELDRP